MGVDAENSSHMKKSILHLIKMFKQPKYMNKNDFFFGGVAGGLGPTRQPFTHV